MDEPQTGATEAGRWEMLLAHRERTVATLQRATRSRAEAEDCVHEAMLRLVRRRDLDPTRVHSLLTRTALHIAMDHLRSRRRRDRAVVRLGGGAMSEVVSPDDLLLEREEARRVAAAVRSLPRRERQVMLLRLAGLSVGETARTLGLSYKSVEGAYTRARARVRGWLGGARLAHRAAALAALRSGRSGGGGAGAALPHRAAVAAPWQPARLARRAGP
jgi:RNA polymerase sigma-70 factor (ECF subfamily)